MSVTSILLSALVVFGIGLVIFVHELGHYMAARWCGARVEVFSLGFGPRLFGWKRGDTLFQVAAVPLGGYVKVAGEYHDGTSPEEPGTLSSLNVPQRFLYYSGGVIMNVVFALVVMPLVMFAGLPAIEAVVGTPTPGMPAWEAGVPAGSRVLKINSTEITDFEHLFTAVAVNGKDEVRLEVLEPGSETPRTYQLQPRFDETYGLYRLGLPQGMSPARTLVIQDDSPAAEAGLTAEDRLIAVEGQPEALAIDHQLVRAMRAGGPVSVRVAGPNGAERTVAVGPTSVTGEQKLVGVGQVTSLVKATRTTGPAAPLITALGLLPGDIIERVGDTPVYSPFGMQSALLEEVGSSTLAIGVDRDGEDLVLTAALDGSVPPYLLVGDIAFEGLTDSTYVTVSDGAPAARAGLRDGDRIISVNGTMVENWDSLLEEIRGAIAGNYKVELLAYREMGAEAVEEIKVTVEGELQSAPSYGFALAGATTVLRAETLGGAISAGVGATQRFLVDVYLQLKKMLFSNEISTKNLGGIISISVISFDTASQGLPKLFFFLAILSINLAIINLLPIPILDGGHLLFLLIEGVKGSPVSERTFGYSQVVGLVMIMSIMVYVTYQDIVRWFLPS